MASHVAPGMRRAVVFVCLLLCAGVGLWLHFSGSRTASRGGPPPQPVRVATARLQDVPQFLSGLGTVTPSASVVVRSRVDGQLLRLHFEDGQEVAAGDLLAEIDPRPFEAQLAEARGQLARDEAILENARRDLARYNRLVKGDFIAAQQADSQQATVRQYEGVVQSDRAQVDAAALQLVYSRITAPMDGRLGLRNVDAGNMIRTSDSDGLVRLTRTRPSDVVFTLPESQVGDVVAALKRGEELPVETWDREQRRLLATGRLLTVDNQIDSATGTVRLKARFANADDALFPNQFVNARLRVRILRDAVTVPASAIQLGARGAFVYVLGDDGIVHSRPVRPGWNAGTLTVVDEGLRDGDVVVTDGVDRLRDGLPARAVGAGDGPRSAPQGPATPPARQARP